MPAGRIANFIGRLRPCGAPIATLGLDNPADRQPPEVVAGLIRKALEHVPPERLVLSSDCGFGREGLSRRIAFYKAVAINLGANIVRRELKLPEVAIPAADARYTFSG